MIKVNLLTDHTARARRTFVKPNVSRIGLVFLAIAVLAVGVMGFWTFYVNRQIKTGVERRDALRLEEARLQKLQQEIAQFEKLKQARQNRINVIEQLKGNQTGPVLLLNNVIQSIPRTGNLWLTSMNQKAESIKIIGMTQQPEVIPDFMTNLMTCGMFQSVDLEMIESQKDASKFSLVCISRNRSEAEERNGN
jgi:type IV pilus assembly protein PilN